MRKNQEAIAAIMERIIKDYHDNNKYTKELLSHVSEILNLLEFVLAF